MVLVAVFGGPSYTVSDVGVLAPSSSAIEVGFKLANNGVSSGRPKCVITVSVPGGSKSTRSLVLPTLKVGHTLIVRHIELAVAEQHAHQITKQDVAISC